MTPKAKNKKHFKNSYKEQSLLVNSDGDPKYRRYVTGDQVSITDFDGTVGIGNFKYAILWCKLEEDAWDFVPIKDSRAETLEPSLRDFIGILNIPESDIVIL